MENWRKFEQMSRVLLAVSLLAVAADRSTAAPSTGSGKSGTIVGELSQVRGQVLLKEAGKLAARQIARFALLHDGDTICLGGEAAAQVRMETGIRFVLSSGSTVALAGGHLRLLHGSKPQTLANTAATELPSGLMDQSREAMVVRGPAKGWGPKDPSPFFTVRGPAVTLQWTGQIDPEEAISGDGELRVRISDSQTGRRVFTRGLPLQTQAVRVPNGTLVPGQWYLWSVSVVGPTGTRLACQGPLRLLTPQERTELTAAEQEIVSQKIARDHPEDKQAIALARRRVAVFLTFGLWEDAKRALQEAPHPPGNSAEAIEDERLNSMVTK